jgi:integrase
LRHISPGEEIRLEAAVRAEDARSWLEMLTAAVAAPRVERNSALPNELREAANTATLAWARRLLQRMRYTVPPRLEFFLMLTLDTGMLIEETLEVTLKDINTDSGRVTLSRDRGNGIRYQLDQHGMAYATRLGGFAPSRPLLRLDVASLEHGWRRACDEARAGSLTLRDLEFEAQYRLRLRQFW